MSLFRPEALQEQAQAKFGKVLINIPFHFGAFSWGIALFMLCALSGLLFLEWEEKYQVRGFVNSIPGLSQIKAHKAGRIKKIFVDKNEHVQAGMPLYLIDIASDEYTAKESKILIQETQLLSEQIMRKKKLLDQMEPLWQRKLISLVHYQAIKDDLATLQSQINQQKLTWIHHQNANAYWIKAPISGMVSNIMAHDGDSIETSKPLMQILPEQAKLFAELFIPIKKSGFIQSGTKILIQYDAFPHQKFGMATATIQSIAESVLTDAEEEKPLQIGEPYYKASAFFNEEASAINPLNQWIKHGMSFSAIISGQKKKIWQWVLDPFESIHSLVSQ